MIGGVRQAPLVGGAVPAYSVSFRDSRLRPRGVREDLARGMVAGVGTEGRFVRNDFDALNIFYRPICNATWNAEKRCWDSIVFREESSFTWHPTAPNREVVYRCTPFYYKLDMQGESAPSWVSVSPYPLPGYTLAPMFKNALDYVYRPAFEAAIDPVDGLPHSRAGLRPLGTTCAGVIEALRQYDAAARPEGYAEYFSDLLLMWVEFATRDLCSVMSGARFCNRGGQATYGGVDALGHSLLYLGSAYANYFCRDMEISVKSAAGEMLAESISILSVSRQTNGSLCLTLSDALAGEGLAEGAALSLTSLYWRTGAVLPHLSATSGARTELQGDLAPCAWRGKENAWGNRPKMLWDFRSNATRLYYLPTYADWSASLTDSWKPLDAAVNPKAGYIQAFSFSAEFPHLMLPSKTSIDRAELSCFGAYFSRPARGSSFFVTVGAGDMNNGYHNPASLRCLASNASYIGGRLICE